VPPDDDPIAEDAYDELADEYDEDVKSNAYNAHLEFPATSSLVPDVEGKQILDAGCGTGVYTAWLLDQGADVVGVDVSEAMLARARENTGGRADLQRADLGAPLPVAEDSFDGVLSALALDYVEQWEAPLSEFARLVRPGAFLVFSVAHPLDVFEEGGESNYFAVERQTKEWAVDVPYYRRPFSAVVEPLLDAGFDLERVVEPQPTEAFRELRPERYEKESRNPVFLCVRARLAE
jgi:SAM-dependent methyltransferase